MKSPKLYPVFLQIVEAGMFKTAETTKRVITAIYPRDEKFKISNNLETVF